MPRAGPPGQRCHGLAPGEGKDATGLSSPGVKMPRACPVESHAGCYTLLPTARLDATGLSRGGFTFQAN